MTLNFWPFNLAKTRLLEQMTRRRALPIGAEDFEAWAWVIIKQASLPSTTESQKFALAEMLMHIKPTEDHESNAYFIKALRKSAVNQVAYAKMTQIRDEAKARLSADELAKLAPRLVTTAQSDGKNLSV
jgi:hypothetical protein